MDRESLQKVILAVEAEENVLRAQTVEATNFAEEAERELQAALPALFVS
jgi:hypothetical protein